MGLLVARDFRRGSDSRNGGGEDGSEGVHCSGLLSGDDWFLVGNEG